MGKEDRHFQLPGTPQNDKNSTMIKSPKSGGVSFGGVSSQYKAHRPTKSEADKESNGAESRGGFAVDWKDIERNRRTGRRGPGSVRSGSSRSSGLSSRIARSMGFGVVGRWFNRIPLLYKATIIMTVPMIVIMAFAAVLIKQAVDETKAAKVIKEGDHYANHIAHILHHTELERDETALWLDAKNINAPAARILELRSILEDQRADTDKYIGDFNSFLDSLKYPDLQSRDTYREAMNSMSSLTTLRGLIDEGGISGDEVLEFYTETNRKLVLTIGDLTVITKSYKVMRLYSCLLAQLYENQHATQERALGTATINHGHWIDEEHLRRYHDTIAVQNEFEALVDTYATEKVKAAKAQFKQENLQAFITLDRFRVTLLSGDNAAIAAIGTDAFFETTTTRLSVFEALEAVALAEITEEADKIIHNIIWLEVCGLLLLVCLTIFLTWLLVKSVQVSDKVLREEVMSRKHTEKAISRFLPISFLRLLGQDRVSMVEAGMTQQLELTVMFADIRNFTSMCEVLPLHDVYDILLEFTQIITPIVEEHNGFVDKYLGDGVMAMFSSPQNAVEAAVAMQVEMGKANCDRTGTLAMHNFQFKVGIGLHTGQVMLGMVGNDQRLDGTVVGDTVNTAARVEGLTKTYDAQIIISESTHEQCDLDSIDHRCIANVKMVGKASSMKVFEIYQANQETLRKFKEQVTPHLDRAMALSEQKDDAKAMMLISQIIQAQPRVVDGPILKRYELLKSTIGTLNPEALASIREQPDESPSTNPRQKRREMVENHSDIDFHRSASQAPSPRLDRLTDSSLPSLSHTGNNSLHTLSQLSNDRKKMSSASSDISENGLDILIHK